MESPADEVLSRTAALAERFAKPEAEAVEPEPTPLPHQAPAGFVDLVFEEHRLVEIVDARGYQTEIGNWLEVGNRRVLRLTWPPSRLSDPNENKVGKAHYGGHSTEHEAAQLVLPQSGTQRAKVLAAFIADWRNGGLGLIHEDVADRTNLGLYSAAPRCTELHDGGWIRASGTYGRTMRGGKSIRWELTPDAIDKLNLKGP